MERASRFIWELSCGKKDRSLFRKAIKVIEKLINNTQDLITTKKVPSVSLGVIDKRISWQELFQIQMS